MSKICSWLMGCWAWPVVVAMVLWGAGCGAREEPAPRAPSGMGAAGGVEFVARYAFRGTVLEDKDLSGIACVSPTRCLIGADEGGGVQVALLSRRNRRLDILQSVSLLGSGDEIDIEGIAAADDCYYITGSHGVAKKSGERQSKRYTICRLRVDAGMGTPVDEPVAVASLGSILESDETLGPYFARPLQQKGVNVEGLAFRDGRLFVGLRNPNLDGFAFVLEVGADEVFANASQPDYVLHKLQLGEGLGIREIVTAKQGFLLIAGNAGSEPSDAFPQAQDYLKGRGYLIYRWPGEGREVQKIGAIPDPPGKAEAMTILEESTTSTTVLILFDGPRNGAPSVYRLH